MIVSIYAAMLALFYVYLSFKTISVRRRLKIGIGDGKNELMMRAMRVQANFAEYVPIALILILLVELSSGSQGTIHFSSILLLLGRCIHAYGVSKVEENYIFRVTGMVLTFTSIFTSASFLLKSSFL